jgi:hypothetical protein
MNCIEFTRALVALIISRGGYTEQMINHAVDCEECRRSVYEEHKHQLILRTTTQKPIEMVFIDYVWAVRQKIK